MINENTISYAVLQELYTFYWWTRQTKLIIYLLRSYFCSELSSDTRG